MWDPGHNNTNGDIVINPRTEPIDAPLDHWVFANTGLQVGDVIPGLIGIEYNAIHPSFSIPDGLVRLIHTQAPDFGNTSGGGFLLPDTFDGTNFNGWYEDAEAFVSGGGTLGTVCDKSPIPPLKLPPPPGGWLMPAGSEACRNPFPEWLVFGTRTDWAMTIYQASSGAWVFNAATNQWPWGLDDYFTGLTTPDGANNGPHFAFSVDILGFTQDW